MWLSLYVSDSRVRHRTVQIANETEAGICPVEFRWLLTASVCPVSCALGVKRLQSRDS